MKAASLTLLQEIHTLATFTSDTCRKVEELSWSGRYIENNLKMFCAYLNKWMCWSNRFFLALYPSLAAVFFVTRQMDCSGDSAN